MRSRPSVRFARVVAVVAVLLSSACTVGSSASVDAPSSKASGPLCTLLKAPLRDLRHRHLSFRDLVELPSRGAERGYAGAAINFALTSGHAEVGPYGPVLGYISSATAARITSTEQRPSAAPKLTAGVVANAEALDRAVANGLCA